MLPLVEASVYRVRPAALEPPMPPTSRSNEDGTIEECIDELDTFVDGLERYSVAVLAFALRVHLSGLLRAMVDGEVCSPDDVRQFVHELEQDALGSADS
jgi:hypothetical protein